MWAFRAATRRPNAPLTSNNAKPLCDLWPHLRGGASNHRQRVRNTTSYGFNLSLQVSQECLLKSSTEEARNVVLVISHSSNLRHDRSQIIIHEVAENKKMSRFMMRLRLTTAPFWYPTMLFVQVELPVRAGVTRRRKTDR